MCDRHSCKGPLEQCQCFDFCAIYAALAQLGINAVVAGNDHIPLLRRQHRIGGTRAFGLLGFANQHPNIGPYDDAKLLVL